jgi:phenolic acid decarboxylase
MALTDMLTVLALVMTVVNGWLVFVMKGLKDDMKVLYRRHDDLVAKQALHEVTMARDTITRAEFKADMGLQTGTFVALLNKLEAKIK